MIGVSGRSGMGKCVSRYKHDLDPKFSQFFVDDIISYLMLFHPANAMIQPDGYQLPSSPSPTCSMSSVLLQKSTCHVSIIQTMVTSTCRARSSEEANFDPIVMPHKQRADGRPK